MRRVTRNQSNLDLFGNRITLFTGVTVQCSKRIPFDAFGDIYARADDSDTSTFFALRKERPIDRPSEGCL